MPNPAKNKLFNRILFFFGLNKLTLTITSILTVYYIIDMIVTNMHNLTHMMSNELKKANWQLSESLWPQALKVNLSGSTKWRKRERETQVAWNRQIECIGILPSSLARITNYGNKFLINLYELFFSPPISFVKFHLSRSPSFPPSKKGEWGEGFNLPWRFPSVTTRYTYVYIWKLACLSLNLGVPFFLSFSSNSTLHSFSFQYSITQYIISQLIIN